MEGTKISAYEQLAEQKKLEESQSLEQAASRNLISDTSKNLTETVQASGKTCQPWKNCGSLVGATSSEP